MDSLIKLNLNSNIDPAAVIQSGNVRFSILKSRLIRMEYDPAQKFEDRPSQVFWYRNQPTPPFRVHEEDGLLIVETDELILRYQIGGEFHHRYLQVFVKATGTTWHYGDSDFSNLGGTYRTLDRADGKVDLGSGLVSYSGWSLVDDSHSLVFTPEGWLERRTSHPLYKDLYFFGYGHNYLDAIREYQEISGKPNLIPRWALGNWWSRYWAYSQEELTSLMQDFQTHNVPLSVCIVDMDWHITATGNASSGWTGYTWNQELFPQPEKFIQFLHNQKLKTALNLHPAEGVHPHEAQYPAMARALGIDLESKQPIPFDIASEDFCQAYFDILHHPIEDQGVDFWWIDWQQGSTTKTKGLDPLYWLNHLHYYDLGRNPEKRPFIFSRWPGLGGHRYPIGFSGDTIVSWASLAFQPEFTATAANVAYGWWSHDIGGHCDGIEEAELYLRWVQYGVFSPILRLHSTNNPYIDRRPWGFGLDTLEIVKNAMQLRHRLIPLLYTANWENASTGEPIILPMYYQWPENMEAYLCPQEYTFCKQLIAAPYTSKVDQDTRLARQIVWLPEGDWFDFFTGEYYAGSGWYAIYGTKSDIPVFARAGVIIPLSDDEPTNGVANPAAMRLRVFSGTNSTYTLYEDDGESQRYLKGEYIRTFIRQTFVGNNAQITIHQSKGAYAGMPEQRCWTIDIVGVSMPETLSMEVNGSVIDLPITYLPTNHTLRIKTGRCYSNERITITAKGMTLVRESTEVPEKVERLIQTFRMPTSVKVLFQQQLPTILSDPAAMKAMVHYFKPSQLLSVYETINGSQPDPISDNLETAYAEMTISMAKKMQSN